jgi:hypothetical protein
MPKRGYKQTEEHKRHIGLSAVGKRYALGSHHKVSETTRKHQSEVMKGRKWTKEQRIKLTGRKLTEESKKKIGMSNKGKKRSSKFIKSMSGKNHHNWKGGITPEIMRIRHSAEYKLWRKAVFERDNYTCIWCGARSEKGKTVTLNADHIKPFALYPELRFAIDNGRTLCKDCHKKTDTYCRKIKIY